jgi:nitrite reductase (NO-forming)
MKQKLGILITGILFIILFGEFTVERTYEFDLEASIKRGKEVYITYCLSCHSEDGQGVEGLYPPVAKSDYLMADTKRSIKQTLFGVTGEMTVNGKVYNMPMDGIDLSDEQTSDVLNYIRNSWGNKGKAVLPEDVKAARNK